MAGDAHNAPSTDTGDGSFTLDGYRRFLKRTIDRYPAVGFDVLGDSELGQKSLCLLRHDIDISPARAVQMARIEAELGVQTTYTVLMTGRFYNPLERDVRDMLLEIVGLGHHVGLHLDAAWHQVTDEESLESAIAWEVETLSNVLKGVPIEMFSFHDPSEQAMALQAPRYGGLWNAYSAVQRENFNYLSDSNGYWRFRSWNEALDEDPERIHILTHPEWWIESFAPPAERISTAITERSIYMWQKYCAGLVATQRVNKSSVSEALDVLPVALGAEGDRIAQQWLSGDRAGAYLGLLRHVRGRAPAGEAQNLAAVGHALVDGEVDPGDERVRAAFNRSALLLRHPAPQAA